MAAGAFHRLFPEADRFAQDRDGLGRRAAVIEQVSHCSDRQRQLKGGIEFRRVPETLDEVLELVQGPLRIALGEERVCVLPLICGGLCREARLTHRVPKHLHPGIAFAEAAGHL